MADRIEVVTAVLSAELAKPYTYGEADCFMLGCRMADKLAGTDMVKRYGGSYSTLSGAQRALRRRRCTTLAELFPRHLTPCAPAEAALGDIVILRLPDGADHVGICLGRRFVTKTEAGRQDYEIGSVIAAFRT